MSTQMYRPDKNELKQLTNRIKVLSDNVDALRAEVDVLKNISLHKHEERTYTTASRDNEGTNKKAILMRKLKKFLQKIGGKANNETHSSSSSEQTYLIRMNDQSRDKCTTTMSNGSAVFDQAAHYENSEMKGELSISKSSTPVEQKYVSRYFKAPSQSVYCHGNFTRRVINKKLVQRTGYECTSNDAHSESYKLCEGHFSCSSKLRQINATRGQRFARKKEEDRLNELRTIKNAETTKNTDCPRLSLSGQSESKSSAPFAVELKTGGCNNWGIRDTEEGPIRRKPRTYIVNNEKSQGHCNYLEKVNRAMLNGTPENTEVLKKQMSLSGEMIPMRDTEHFDTNSKLIDNCANDSLQRKESYSVVRILNDVASSKGSCSGSDNCMCDSLSLSSQCKDDCPRVMKQIRDISYCETFKYSNLVTLESLIDSGT